MSHRKSHRRPATANLRQRARQQSSLSLNTKLTVGLVAAVVAIVMGLFLVGQGREDASAAGAGALVRSDSHRLAAADGKVTIVEFLDFECPACAIAHPEVDKILVEYRDRITYVVRQFPLPMHRNADSSARAAQAAAAQGQFKAMYDMLFANQSEWGNQTRDHAATFEMYALQIGLDVPRYRADVDSSAIADQIAVDLADGAAIGLTGTPTFFLNGQKFDQSPTYANLKAAIEAALEQ